MASPRVLLCALGGLSYGEDWAAFFTSSLGQVYRSARDDGLCDVLIVDPMVDENGTPYSGSSTMDHLLQMIPSTQDIQIVRAPAESLEYAQFAHKYAGGLCFILDIEGRGDQHKWHAMRVATLEAVAVLIRSEPELRVSVFWNFNVNHEWTRVWPPIMSISSVIPSETIVERMLSQYARGNAGCRSRFRVYASQILATHRL